MANIKGGTEKPIFSVFVCLEKSRKGLLSYGCSCVCCKMNWNSVVLLLMRVEIRKTLRKTSQSKGDNQQESQPTCDDDSRIRTRWQFPSHRCAVSLAAVFSIVTRCVTILKTAARETNRCAAAGNSSLKGPCHEDIDVLGKFCAKLINNCLYLLLKRTDLFVVQMIM